MNVNFNGGMPKSVQQKKSFNKTAELVNNKSNIAPDKQMDVSPGGTNDGTTVIRTAVYDWDGDKWVYNDEESDPRNNPFIIKLRYDGQIYEFDFYNSTINGEYYPEGEFYQIFDKEMHTFA